MPGGDNTSAGELRKLSGPAVREWALHLLPQLRNWVLALEAEIIQKSIYWGHRCFFGGSHPFLGVTADIYWALTY